MPPTSRTLLPPPQSSMLLFTGWLSSFFRCVPKPQVCLTTFDTFGCSQYECVHRQLTCEQVRDPVCDTEHVEHSNLCTLYQRGKSLSYRGPCQVCQSLPNHACHDLSRPQSESSAEKGVVWLCGGSKWTLASSHSQGKTKASHPVWLLPFICSQFCRLP